RHERQERNDAVDLGAELEVDQPLHIGSPHCRCERCTGARSRLRVRRRNVSISMSGLVEKGLTNGPKRRIQRVIAPKAEPRGYSAALAARRGPRNAARSFASRSLTLPRDFSLTWPKPRICSGRAAICTASAWLSPSSLWISSDTTASYSPMRRRSVLRSAV